MVPVRRLSKAAQWEAAPGTTSWWNLPLPARGRRREAACESVPEAEREDLPGKRVEKQACPRSGARRRWNEKSQTGAERHQVVLSGGPTIKTHMDPESAADHSSELHRRPGFTVNNYKPETSNRRLPSLHFFCDWLVPHTDDGNLRLTELHVWVWMHRLWLPLKVYLTGCAWTSIKTVFASK